MSDMDEVTKPQRTSLDVVDEMSDAERALGIAHDEARFMRNEAIARAYEEGRGGPVIGSHAEMHRTHPYNIWKGQMQARLRRRAEYPDQVEVLLAARSALNYLIREARIAAGDPDQ